MTDFLRIYKEKYDDKRDTIIGRILSDFIAQINEKFISNGIISHITVNSSDDVLTHNVVLEKDNFFYRFITVKSKLDELNIFIESISVYKNDPIEFRDISSEEEVICLLTDIMGYDRTIILFKNILSINTYK